MSVGEDLDHMLNVVLQRCHEARGLVSGIHAWIYNLV